MSMAKYVLFFCVFGAKCSLLETDVLQALAERSFHRIHHVREEEPCKNHQLLKPVSVHQP